MTSLESEEDETSPNSAAILARIESMLANQALFQQRARQWVQSPAFRNTYIELHPGLIFTTLMTLLGGGKSVKMRTPAVWADYQRLASGGELLFASVVIASNQVSKYTHLMAPATLIASRHQDAESLINIAAFGNLLCEAYTLGDIGGNLQSTRIIADDDYRPRRRRALPLDETEGLPMVLFDVKLSADETIRDLDAMPFMPLLAMPEQGAFVVVPWHVLHGKPQPTLPPEPSASPARPSSLPPPIPGSASGTKTSSVPPPIPGRAVETSPGGSDILRHQAREHAFALATGGDDMEAISTHIERYIGPVASVYHELVSDLVHLDIHIVMPTAERPCYTLITSGMSDRPMTTPPGAEDYRHAELMLCLPADWKLGIGQTGAEENADFKDERNYWPLRWLKKLARLPHEYDTWLGPAHTIPNGDPAEPVADGVPFSGFMIGYAYDVPEEFHQLSVSPQKTINFYALLPLTSSEMAFKLSNGAAALAEKLSEHQITELINIHRPPVA